MEKASFAQIKKMTNEQIEQRLHALVAAEWRITQEILLLIREVESRRLYRQDEHASIYSWLIQKFGYSQTAANRRIQASRLLQDIPDAADKILTGKVNLSTLQQVHVAVRKEEKRCGHKLAVEMKEELVRQVENKSMQETEFILFQAFPESAKRTESLRSIDAQNSKLTVTLESSAKKNLERSREILSHKIPDGSWSDVISYLAEFFLNHEDPLLKSVPAK